jgi:hypothetical protein
MLKAATIQASRLGPLSPVKLPPPPKTRAPDRETFVRLVRSSAALWIATRLVLDLVSLGVLCESPQLAPLRGRN